MERMEDLVPKLEELERLYQQEEFQILVQFLSKSKEQSLAELLGVDLYGDSAKQIKAVRLQTTVSILSAILELPKVVRYIKQELKKQEDQKAKLKEMQQVATDPLDQ